MSRHTISAKAVYSVDNQNHPVLPISLANPAFPSPYLALSLTGSSRSTLHFYADASPRDVRYLVLDPVDGMFVSCFRYQAERLSKWGKGEQSMAQQMRTRSSQLASVVVQRDEREKVARDEVMTLRPDRVYPFLNLDSFDFK
jgi:hypothetical protein